jgi:hypothetical protein
MDLADISRLFHSTSAQYIFFSAAHGNFSKTDQILDIKQVLANIRKLK